MFDRARLTPTLRGVCASTIMFMFLLVVPASRSAGATTVNRCEGADHSVVYSNEGCPPGTKLVRSFEPSPPVIVTEPRTGEAKADGAGRPVDARDVDRKDVERKDPERKPPDRKARKEQDARGSDMKAATVPLRREAAKAPVQTPEEARAAATVERQRSIDECDALVRRIEFAEQDLVASTAGDKASAELIVRRLQQQHAEQCRPRR